MTKKVKTILIEDNNGRKIYEGSERRMNDLEINKTFFGLSLPDTIKIFIYTLGLVIFLVKTDYRITTIEKALIDNNRKFDVVATFMQSSDTYHSTITGLQFRGGEPLQSNLNYEKIRNLFNKEDLK